MIEDMVLPILVLLPLVGAFVSYGCGRRDKGVRNIVQAAFCVVEFLAACAGLALVLCGRTLNLRLSGICGFGLGLKMDGFRAVYAVVASFMWMMTGLFSPAYFARYRHRNRYFFFTLLTLSATMGVFLSDDLYTTFVFFEIMSLSSYPWVAHEEEPEAMRAAETYLAIAILGGMATLMGLFMLNREIGTLVIDDIWLKCRAVGDKGTLYVCGSLIFFGFAAKAGAFPLHVWLPKAHPVAPAPASALLSGVLTKSGVYGMLAVSLNIFRHDPLWGRWVLALGVITMVLGALLAMFSVNLKRTLACSSLSQIGFVMVGMGMQELLGAKGALAAQGAVLHMVNHSLIKLTLFMAAGVVYMNTHKLDLNEVRGFGRGKPLLHFAFLMGALGIAGVPLWNGFLSKSLLHESILEYIAELGAEGIFAGGYRAVEWIFLCAGGMTAAYMTKLYVALFWEKNANQAEMDAMNGRYLHGWAAFALLGSALVLPVIGLLPSVFANRIASLSAGFLRVSAPNLGVAYFSGENLLGAFESLGIGAALYFGVIRPVTMRKRDGVSVYVDRWPKWLDLENSLYRPVLAGALPRALLVLSRGLDQLMDGVIVKALPWCMLFLTRCLSEAVDGLAVVLHNTVLAKSRARAAVPIGTRLSYAMGRIFNGVAHGLNLTVCRRHPITTDFIYWFAAGREEFNESTRKITRSVSFGLLLLCIGLLITFLYLSW